MEVPREICNHILKSPHSFNKFLFLFMPSTNMLYISSWFSPQSILVYFNDLYILSTCSFQINGSPLKVLKVSNTVSPRTKPKSSGSIFTSDHGFHSPLW